MSLGNRHPPTAPGKSRTSSSPLATGYWKSRLVTRKYTTHTRPGSEMELFARIEWKDHWAFFPLDSKNPDAAAERARDIYQTAVTYGWPAVCSQFVRELTLSVFWLAEPLSCTYTTLFTKTDPTRGFSRRENPTWDPTWDTDAVSDCGSPPPAVRVAVAEPDEIVRHTLKRWLDGIPGYTCVQAAAKGKLLLKDYSRTRPHFILFDRNYPETASGRWLQWFHKHEPDIPTFPFAITGTSLYVFTNMNGADRGYFLRRRPPNQMLEPVEWVFREGQPSLVKTTARIRKYFQKLTYETLQSASVHPSPLLTTREAEILGFLGAGHTDKSIAKALGISVWTVHDHFKTIFRKLGVHTRTEALNYYLQK